MLLLRPLLLLLLLLRLLLLSLLLPLFLLPRTKRKVKVTGAASRAGRQRAVQRLQLHTESEQVLTVLLVQASVLEGMQAAMPEGAALKPGLLQACATAWPSLAGGRNSAGGIPCGALVRAMSRRVGALVRVAPPDSDETLSQSG